MEAKIKYWLSINKNTAKKILTPLTPGFRELKWEEIEHYPIWIGCDQDTWPYLNLYNDSSKIITNQEQRKHIIGKATIKEIRGGTKENPEGAGTQAIKLLFKLEPWFKEEHPSTSKEFFERSNHWKFAPRFENLQEGIFENVSKIDIKSCYANIMRDYPLPCGEPELISDPLEIEKRLKAGASGFVSFYARQDAVIKNNQIPFLPDSDSSEIVPERLRPYHLLHTKLLKTFQHQYGKKGKLIYKNFWIFKEKKGCVDKFLDYCQELKKTDEKKGKTLANSLYGYLGKNSFSGYHYHPFHLAVNHLAVLKTYCLYREFSRENVLAIRVDCIYVKGELPTKILQEKDKYHIEKFQKVGFGGKENVFKFDTEELLARLINQEVERRQLVSKFKEEEKQ